jgi:hypothetical protein
VWEAEARTASVAVTVKVNVPAVVGVPVIVPLVPFSDRPGGRLTGASKVIAGVEY